MDKVKRKKSNLTIHRKVKLANANLNKARKQKNDEFYTQYIDIENELQHYKKHFKNKVVYCNCDDPRKSNFVKYFIDNFVLLGLKKLIAVGYIAQGADLFTEQKPEKAICLVHTSTESITKELNGNGDFRSKESIEFLKQADIVVTNPPFSLFREYVAQLVEYDKKFLIIGNQNAITGKVIFPLIKDNKVRLGCTLNSGSVCFINEHYKDYSKSNNKTIGIIEFSGVSWFTNLKSNKQNDYLQLDKTYTPEQYPKYDNYDAINVNKTKDIPKDYAGAIGVPITFLHKYNPEQFEIIDGISRYSFLTGTTEQTKGKYLTMINGICKYSRIIIKHKPQENQWQS